ncbi:MAG: DnaJ domain-containing protein [bacterium]|nr:DnaJ domain-containing protein [bacterium]
MDHYETLGVSYAASDAQIKRAYRLLVKQYHPDINSTDEAHERIRAITIAYEVLSDPYSKRVYDLKHVYGSHPNFNIPNDLSPEEERRRSYREKAVAEERKYLEQLLRLKVKFYSIQRVFCMLFAVLAVIYTVDYLFMGKQITEVVESVSLKKIRSDYSTEIRTHNRSIRTSREFYDFYSELKQPYMQVYYSSVFNNLSMVGIKDGSEIKKFSVIGSIHSYGNALPYGLFLLCMIIIQKRKYSDWALTLAIIPFFIVAFLIAQLI